MQVVRIDQQGTMSCPHPAGETAPVANIKAPFRTEGKCVEPAGLLAGWYLDRLLDSSPVLTLVLAIAGAAGGMLAVYRLVMKTIADDDRTSARR